MREKILLIIILFIAFLTRVLFLNDFPNGFSGDEVQQGYSAYSILKTGKDEWGDFLPLFPRGFGDFKPPLFTYLTIPSVAVFGLNIEAVRISAAMMGVLTVLVIYFLVNEIFYNSKIALWSSFLLSVNPWHIQLSRTAFEAGSGVLFFCLGLLFYLKSKKVPQFLILSSIFWGLTLYSYHSFRIFVPLFILGLAIADKLFLKNRQIILPFLIFMFFLMPIILNMTSTAKRALDVGIISQTFITNYFENKGTSSIPPILDKLMDNKVLYVTNQFFINYLSYFSPTFFFTGERSNSSYLNFPMFPLLYPVELFFWIAGFYFILFKKEKNFKILLWWFLLAPIPASLAQGQMHAHRAVTFLPLISIMSGFGLVKFLQLIKFRFWGNFFYKEFVLVGILILSFTIFARFYFIKLPQNPPESLRVGYEQTFKKILEIEKNYDRIVISKSFTQPQIFIGFYGKVDPIFYQQASQSWLRYEKANKLYIDQLESWNLGKFLFEDVNWTKKDSKRPNALVVSKPEDFPENIRSVFDIKGKKGKVLYRLVPTKQ